MSEIRRVGLIGFGAVAEGAHAPCLREKGVAVAAVAEVSADRREAARRAFPEARVYDGHAALLAAEKGMNALIVTTPPLYHCEAVLAGLRAGLNVLCEKPLTLDPEAAEAMRAQSEARALVVYSVNNWAYAPALSRLLGIAASGRLGAIRHVEIQVLRTKPSVSARPGDWRRDPAISGGGILVDHGWHNLYLMRRLLGPRTRLLSAALMPAGAVDEVATVLLGAPAATGTLHLSWKAAERSNSVSVIGEKGTAELRDEMLIVRADGAEETIRFQEKLSAGSAHPEWLSAMWPAFEAECAGRGRGENMAEAAFCMETIRSAYAGREAMSAR